MALLSSRNNKTITGKTINGKKTKATTIKPAKTRKIIRRFHFLIKCRRNIIKLMTSDGKYKELLQVRDNEEEHNQKIFLKFFKKQKLMTTTTSSSGGNDNKKKNLYAESEKKELEDQLLKLNSRNLNNKTISGGAEENNGMAKYLKLLQYINVEINDNGGLQNYQLASIMGQDNNRGGDSSKLLIKWLQELNDSSVTQEDSNDKKKDNNNNEKKYSLMSALEIGCLDANNYINKFPKLINQIERIDLNSNDDEKIKKQDFMERPLPKGPISSSSYFDLISCSLVLNFVPIDNKRGEMLKRIKLFLRDTTTTTNTTNTNTNNTNTNTSSKSRGLLFLVLPLPCIDNSRYLNETIFENEIMFKGLNFKMLKKHKSEKIIYYLFEQTNLKINHNILNNFKTKKKLANNDVDGSTSSTSSTSSDKLKTEKKKLNNFCILFE